MIQDLVIEVTAKKKKLLTMIISWKIKTLDPI